MAEFCLECWNKINNSNDTEVDFIISDDLDFCEECGEWKHIIVVARKTRLAVIAYVMILVNRIVEKQ